MISRHRIRRLLAPTTGLRRALLGVIVGGICFLFGFALSFKLVLLPLIQSTSSWWNSMMIHFVPEESLDQSNHFVGGALLLLGLILLFRGVKSIFHRILEIINPSAPKSKLVSVIVRRQQLAAGPKIVALGGGTGLSTLLRGLKQHSVNITAIVTVTDDGGSSGRLVQEMKMIPPGDIRNCLVALADAEKLMTDLFQHRFQIDSGSLSGHSTGNLLIAALVEQSGGDYDKALEVASEVLAIRGRVVPSTFSNIRLRALLEDGAEVCGETAISKSGKRIRRVYIDPEDAVPHADALEAIRDADLICIGPGSVYTSVIPNLLVPGIAEAIHDAHAIKAYVCNVMTQPGESDSFTATEHVVAIQANVAQRVFDYVLVNTGMPSSEAIDRYRESGQHLVEADTDRIRAMGYRVVTGNFMSESDYVRHDPARVASRLVDLLNR